MPWLYNRIEWRDGNKATQCSTSELKIADQITFFLVRKHRNTGNHSGGSRGRVGGVRIPPLYLPVSPEDLLWT